MIVGIDNGLKGGICILSNAGEIIALRVMPIWTPSGEKKDEIDPLALYIWFTKILAQHPHDSCKFLIEKPVGAKSANAIRSMASSFASVFAVCDLLVHGVCASSDIYRITARDWQNVMLPKAKDTKKSAVARAKTIWPYESFHASAKCRTPHLGLVDASLIAEYGRLIL